jgi:hypothetical protein
VLKDVCFVESFATRQGLPGFREIQMNVAGRFPFPENLARKLRVTFFMTASYKEATGKSLIKTTEN